MTIMDEILEQLKRLDNTKRDVRTTEEQPSVQRLRHAEECIQLALTQVRNELAVYVGEIPTTYCWDSEARKNLKAALALLE